MSDEALTQAMKVEDFRKRVANSGVLYKKFRTAEELGKLLEVDIPLCLRDRFSRTTDEGLRAVADLPKVPDQAVNDAEDLIDEDLGYLDYAELFQDAMCRIKNSTKETAVQAANVGQRTEERMGELQASKQLDGTVDTKRDKLVINKTASDYDEFCQHINRFTDTMSVESRAAIEAFKG